MAATASASGSGPREWEPDDERPVDPDVLEDEPGPIPEDDRPRTDHLVRGPTMDADREIEDPAGEEQ